MTAQVNREMRYRSGLLRSDMHPHTAMLVSPSPTKRHPDDDQDPPCYYHQDELPAVPAQKQML